MNARMLKTILAGVPDSAEISVNGEDDVLVEKYEHGYKKESDNRTPVLAVNFKNKKTV